MQQEYLNWHILVKYLFVSVGFIIIGIIIYGAESTTNDYSGAFAITIIAGIIALVAGILGLLDWMGKGK